MRSLWQWCALVAGVMMIALMVTSSIICCSQPIRLVLAHPANAHPANAHPANAHPANAHPANAHPGNAAYQVCMSNVFSMCSPVIERVLLQ